MSDLVATRYGVLGRTLSVAVLQTIVLTSRDAVNALNNLCLGSLLVDTLPPGHDSPVSGKWQELLGNLFPAEILVLDSSGVPSSDLLELPATDAEERAIRRLLAAAAAFLLSESAIVEEAVSLVDESATDPAVRGRVVQAVRVQAQLVSAASDALLDHAEAGSWRALLSTFVGDRTPAAPEVSAADVLPRDREFPPVVVSFADEPITPAWPLALPWRYRQTPCVVVGYLPRPGRLRVRQVLQQIGLDQDAAYRDALDRAPGTVLRMLSAPDTTIPRYEVLRDMMFRLLSHARTTHHKALALRMARGEQRLRPRVGPTARIADLLVGVGPDLAPAVGAAFRALAAASPDGEDALASVVRHTGDGLASRLSAASSVFRHDEQDGLRRLASLCRLLPDDLQTAAIVALAHRRAYFPAPEPVPLDIKSGLQNAFVPHDPGAPAPAGAYGILDDHLWMTVSSPACQRTVRCRPRIKREHWPVRYGGDRVHIGGVVSGIPVSVSDPDGWVWALLGALDGTRTVDEIIVKLVERFPTKSDLEVLADLGKLVRAGYVEDTEPEPDALTARSNDRHSRTTALWGWMDPAPRSSSWNTQLSLRQARVVVVGVGGVGCSAALALAQSGVGELHLVEPDVVTMSNLVRQVLYVEQDLGRPKVDVAVERLRGYNSDVAVTGEALAVTGPVKLAELARRFDLMVLTVDQPHGIRSWANDACEKAGTPWVHSGYSGSVVSMGLYRPGAGRPCYACTTAPASEDPGWPVDSTQPQSLPSEAGNAVSAGIAGSMAANAVKSLITGVPEMPANREYAFNLVTLDSSVRVVDEPGPDCPTCGQKAHSA